MSINDLWKDATDYITSIRTDIFTSINNQLIIFPILQSQLKITKSKRPSYNREMYLGINFENESGLTVFYLSMTSFDIDSGTKNIHTYPGRICLMISKNGKDAGNPNEGASYITDIAYPNTNEKSNIIKDYVVGKENGKFVFDNTKIKDFQIYATGYSLFSQDLKCRYELLNEENMDDFVNLVLAFIENRMSFLKA
ncbi:MAG: hypothetical protein E7242_10645 [Lachnospiraceae bacterium]|nr:hypothetical protein [Lachnospiraceae bacterium]